MSPSSAPSEAEWKVLRIVSSRGSCAARDVIQVAEAEYGWSPSTVKTLLRRLVEKGQLKTRRVGNANLYRPARSLMRPLREAADRLLDNARDGAVAPLLAYMVRRGELSREEIDELRRLLDEDQGGQS